MATIGPDPKRMRDTNGLEDTSSAKRAKQDEQQDPAQHTSVLNVPAMGDQIEGSVILPALQQLLAVYKVEYWALLEEIRTKRHAYCEAGRHCAADLQGASKGAAQPDTAATQGSMRQLLQALQADPTAAGMDDVVLVAEHDKQQQQGNADAQPEGQEQQQSLYGDERCGYGKPGEQPLPPAFSEAESALLQLPPGTDTGCATTEQLQAWHARFKGAAAAIAGLEQLASAATMQYMDAQGGLACFCGAGGRWIIRRTAVSIGRSSDSKGDVDVDLSKAAADMPAAAGAAVGSATPAGVPMTPAGAAMPAAAAVSPGAAVAAVGAGAAAVGLRTVSRLQAQLSLGLDGCWSICNTGRAVLAVNGRRVARGSSVELPHLSLLEIAGEPLLFMVNGMAVKRAVMRSSQLLM